MALSRSSAVVLALALTVGCSVDSDSSVATTEASAPQPTVAASAKTDRVTLNNDDPIARLEFVAACVEDRGFDIAVDIATSSWEAEVPPEQQPLLTGAVIECTDLAREAGLIPRPPSEAEIRRYFETQLATAGCLREHGIPVDESPSVEVYVGEFVGPSGPSWNPYTAARKWVDTGSADLTWDQIIESCPRE